MEAFIYLDSLNSFASLMFQLVTSYSNHRVSTEVWNIHFSPSEHQSTNVSQCCRRWASAACSREPLPQYYSRPELRTLSGSGTTMDHDQLMLQAMAPQSCNTKAKQRKYKPTARWQEDQKSQPVNWIRAPDQRLCRQPWLFVCGFLPSFRRP